MNLPRKGKRPSPNTGKKRHIPVKAKAEIKVAMRVSLEIQLKDDINGMKIILTLNSVVEEILEEGSLLIQMPIYHGYHYPLPRENILLMHFFVDLEMYALPIQFEERIERDGFISAKVRRRGKIKSHQRRDCYRFPCSLVVTVGCQWQHEKKIHPERQLTEGRIINFSDGGMLFATYETIEKGEKVTLTFDMGDIETVEGLVLRTECIEDGKYLFKVAVQFQNTDVFQRCRFYKYIVDMQQEKRRRCCHIWLRFARPPKILPLKPNSEKLQKGILLKDSSHRERRPADLC